MPYHRRGNFTERSYRVVELAEQSAAELRHASVTPTHLALGCCVKARALLLRRYNAMDSASMLTMRQHTISLERGLRAWE